MEHIRFTLMAWLNGILLKQCLGWQLLCERYWCLSVGLEYKSVVMLPSLTVMVVSRQDILVFDTSCVNFIDGWILLACSKNSSSSSSTVGQCKPCGDKRCKCCLQLQHTQVFHSKTTGNEYKIFCNRQLQNT